MRRAAANQCNSIIYCMIGFFISYIYLQGIFQSEATQEHFASLFLLVFLIVSCLFVVCSLFIIIRFCLLLLSLLGFASRAEPHEWKQAGNLFTSWLLRKLGRFFLRSLSLPPSLSVSVPLICLLTLTFVLLACRDFAQITANSVAFIRSASDCAGIK